MSLGPLMVAIAGTALSAQERSYLQHPNVGGVVLFARNYADVAQLQALTAELRALRSPHLLIAVDQEGGRVQRFKTGLTHLPAIRDLCCGYDRDRRGTLALIKTMGWLMAAECLALGVDISYAPVLDLDEGSSTVIGDRAFHAQPSAVISLASAYIEGMKLAGMAATGKHFPGHGFVLQDTHHESASDPRSLAEMEVSDLAVYQALMQQARLPSLMVAHVTYPAVDDAPAGFSQRWLQDILRQRMDYQGLIVSDDLFMAAAGAQDSLLDKVRKSLHAGCDMVLLCQPGAEMEAVIHALPQEVSPVRQARLTRMHARHHEHWAGLPYSVAWKQAQKQLRHWRVDHAVLLS